MRKNHSLNKILPKKHLGQNFLIDQNVQDRIIKTCHLKSSDTIFEIGAGTGKLTRNIINKVDYVYAIEKDPRCCRELEKEFHGRGIKIIAQDILKYDLTQLPCKTKVIGNIPYNISTPILEKLLQHRNLFQDIYLMVQLEFAQRLGAKIHTKDYGALSCYVQCFADIKLLFKIKNTCFYPVPKVMSCFIHLSIKEPCYAIKNEDFLFKLIQYAFLNRRKKIGNALAGFSSFSKERILNVLNELRIKTQLRPENLTLKNYIDISHGLSINKKNGRDSFEF